VSVVSWRRRLVSGGDLAPGLRRSFAGDEHHQVWTFAHTLATCAQRNASDVNVSYLYPDLIH
jgi:hypothetical protein